MRLVFDSRSLTTRPAGIGHYCIGVAEGLKSIGDPLEVLHIGLAGAPSPVPLGSTRQSLQTVIGAGPQDRWTRDLWECFEMPRLIRTWRADLLHSLSGLLPLRELTVPTVITIHDLTSIKFPGMHIRNLRYRYKLLLRRSVKRATAIVADSMSTKKDLVELLSLDPDRVIVLHLGVDPKFSPSDQPIPSAEFTSFRLPSRYILAVGTVEPRKNYVRLIKAFDAIASQIDDRIHLVIAGQRGWLAGPTYAAAGAATNSARIRFVDYMPEHLMPEMFRGATAFAYPSLYEGFGLPPLEALASGVPTLTSNVSSLPEVMGDAAVLVDPTDVGKIAASLLNVVTDVDLRARLRQRGLERARTFTWERHAQGLLEIYRTIA